MTRMLVTGAGGFVGRALCAAAPDRKIKLLAVARAPVACIGEQIIVDDIHAVTDWRGHLKNVDIVVHLAARTHLLKDRSDNPLRDYRTTNVDATLNLARQSAEAGVKRLVFLSSVKVNGESTFGMPFLASDAPAPVDPYAISKWEAEQGLSKIARESGLELVIIRPPLIYGPGVKANFLELMRWVGSGIPLPLASVSNRRSLIFVGNLVDMILRCAVSDAAIGQTFLVSDDHDVSSAELIAALALAMNRPRPLFSLPAPVLRIAARLLGKSAAAERLLGSLQVNIQPTKDSLKWTPPFAFQTGVALTVRDFLDVGSTHSPVQSGVKACPPSQPQAGLPHQVAALPSNPHIGAGDGASEREA